LLTGIYYPPYLWLALEAANGSLHPQAEAEVFEQESAMPPNLKFRRHAITELCIASHVPSHHKTNTSRQLCSPAVP